MHNKGERNIIDKQCEICGVSFKWNTNNLYQPLTCGTRSCLHKFIHKHKRISEGGDASKVIDTTRAEGQF